MIVVKLGGSTLDLALKDPQFFEALKGLEGQAVLVHGGGPDINALLEKLNLKSEFLDGQRVTSVEVLKATEMALSGSVNPRLVRHCLQKGIQAFGLSGVDGGLFSCDIENPKLGQVGRITKVKSEILEGLLKAGLLPVIAPIGIFAQSGQACNINADLAAAAVAKSSNAQAIYFLTDRDGILDSDGNVLSQLNLQVLQELEESKIIQGGMLVKARAIREMLQASPNSKVRVVNGNDPQKLKRALNNNPEGTTITF